MSNHPRGPVTDDGATPGLDDDLHGWLDQRGRPTDEQLEAVRGRIASLPDRPAGRRRTILAAAASIALLLGVAGLVIGRVPLIGDVGRAQPPDPAAFAGDPRLADCATGMTDVAQAFEMTHARWFPLHFPGWWGGAEELEVDDPALVVISGERPGQRYVPQPSGLPKDLSTPHPVIDLCIAVGPPGDAIVRRYGPTWFERIVSVLSAADIERAGRMDPEVLADPANWHVPERLAPCGGLTANVQYVFEARSLRDFGRYFPSAAGSRVAAFDTDDGATVVVFRGPSGLGIQPLSIPQQDLGGERHEVCVIFFQPGPAGSAILIRDVDLTGFHVRLEALPDPTPTPAPTTSPAVTPEPAPAWAGDAVTSLECEIAVSTDTPNGPIDIAEDGPTADAALRSFLSFVASGAVIFPKEGFIDQARSDSARLFAYVVDGRIRAAIVAVTRAGRPNAPWYVSSVASCDPAEWNGGTGSGVPLTIWTAPDGSRVPAATLLERDDCYGASVLRLEGRLFVRDPSGGAVDPSQLATTYDGGTRLPSTAVRQPYRDGDRRLFLAPDGKAAYVTSPSGVERWPHVIGDVILRIDCN